MAIITGTISESDFAINVKDYGATGNGTTDDYAAIQAAVDAVDHTYGGRVFFPQGIYRISQAIEVDYDGTELLGEGTVGCSTDGPKGTSQLLVDAGESGIHIERPSNHGYMGCSVRRLAIRAADGSSAGDGIEIVNYEACVIEDVSCMDFEVGAGLIINGGPSPANCSLYNTVRNFSCFNCFYGIHTKGYWPNHTNVFGGRLGGPSRASGSIGIYHERGVYICAWGTAVEGFDIGVKSDANGEGPLYTYGMYFEANTTAVHVGYCSTFLLVGASIDGNGGGATPTGIYIASQAVQPHIMPVIMVNCTTKFDNHSSSAVIYHPSYGLYGTSTCPREMDIYGQVYANLVTLTDAATIAVNMGNGNHFTVTTTQARTMGNPTNAEPGQTGVFIIKGGYAITWSSNYYFPQGTAPTISGTCIVPYFVESSSVIYCGSGLLEMAVP